MNKKIFKKRCLNLVLAFSCLLLVKISVFGQSVGDQNDPNDLYDLTLEELLNITIKSASQKEERLFDAPVDSYSITKEQIRRSGVTSIPEALRLFPGVIVRQTSNGNYDIHLRGFENVARYSGTQDQTNLLTLVMIDDRPVFNYNNGGTNWESLPIDLIDVERIEIVKGPNSPLFGPNAVTGVINIITRKEKEDIYVAGDISYGTPHTTIANIRGGKKITDKLDVAISGNYQKRDRTDDLYYLYDFETYSSVIDTAFNFSTNYKQSRLALEKYGVNAFVTYEKSTEINFRLSGGYQSADVQKYYLNYSFTSLSPSITNNSYVALEGNYKGFGTRASIINGYDHLVKNSMILVSEYDFTNSNFVLDYSWNPSEKLQLRPAFNYQKASYNDEKYAEGKTGIYGGKKEIDSYALSLRGDYSPTENLRIIAALRTDKFSIPDDYYVSYQFAATQSFLSDKLLVRAAHSRSNSGSFIGNAHINTVVVMQVPTQPLPTTISSAFIGNSDYKLPVVTNTEVGLRAELSGKMNVDLTLFHQNLENTLALVDIDSTFGVGPSGFMIETVSQYMNIPLTAVQNGVTVTLNYIASADFQFSPFATLQKTNVENIPVHFVDFETAPNNIYNGFDDENRTTPSVYGGFYLNYLPVKKLNVNLNSYFFSSHRTYHESDLISPTNTGEIDSKFVLNLKVAYSILNNFNVYVNARNVFNADSREHYGTDRMGSLYLAGLNFNFAK